MWECVYTYSMEANGKVVFGLGSFITWKDL
jgi:hypothetical protein